MALNSIQEMGTDSETGRQVCPSMVGQQHLAGLVLGTSTVLHGACALPALQPNWDWSWATIPSWASGQGATDFVSLACTHGLRRLLVTCSRDARVSS